MIPENIDEHIDLSRKTRNGKSPEGIFGKMRSGKLV